MNYSLGTLQKLVILSIVTLTVPTAVSADQDNQTGLKEQIVRQAAYITPNPQQIRWMKMGFSAFVHFGINTFTGRQWGDGKEDPKLFNPTAFDARQWVRVCKEAGMKMIVLTAKHHDGFCLWPSKYTEHSVKNSPWRDGQGDVVREVSDACREGGLKFGIYLSPWDRHEPSYGDSPRYNEFYKNQLQELLTNYGEISEVWLDGACGEGPNGKVQECDCDGFFGMIRHYQPGAAICCCGPDGYVKDESGYGRETEWMVVPLFKAPSARIYTGLGFLKYVTKNDVGSREMITQEVIKNDVPLRWYISENITSIRPGWFYHANQDEQVKTVEKLLDIYYGSVGRNGPLLLNLPPDRRGLIHETDAQRMRNLGKVLRATFKDDLARGASAKASNIRNNNPAYAPANTVDGDSNTYWITDDGVTAAIVEFDLGQEQTFNRAMLQEHIETGQRVEQFVLELWDGQNWKEFAKGTTIGYKRILRFADVAARKVRLKITRSRVCPTLSNFALFYAPPISQVITAVSRNGSS